MISWPFCCLSTTTWFFNYIFPSRCTIVIVVSASRSCGLAFLMSFLLLPTMIFGIAALKDMWRVLWSYDIASDVVERKGVERRGEDFKRDASHLKRHGLETSCVPFEMTWTSNGIRFNLNDMHFKRDASHLKRHGLQTGCVPFETTSIWNITRPIWSDLDFKRGAFHFKQHGHLTGCAPFPVTWTLNGMRPIWKGLDFKRDASHWKRHGLQTGGVWVGAWVISF